MITKPKAMNRLVQGGDVGSGKNCRSSDCHPAAIQSGYRCADVSTEVPAEQHYRKLVSWFNLPHLPVELLTETD